VIHLKRIYHIALSSDAHDDWFRIRNQEAMSLEKILDQAKVAKSKYGFKDFKLKGGVLAKRK
jgi:glucarate dehydratase